MKAIISMHDVMPHTLTKVHEFIDLFSPLDASSITLLVVPGLHWSGQQLDQLHSWQAQGFILAGHGWLHETREINTVYHRLHSAIISRKAAEHLSLKTEEICQLLENCYQWFIQHDFARPDLYVPPAWAMGVITPEQLQKAPFRYFENTSGLYDSKTNTHKNLPLIGFEADTIFRQTSLKIWNRMNMAVSSDKRPLRISLHPYDLDLRLANSIQHYLDRVTQPCSHRLLFQ